MDDSAIVVSAEALKLTDAIQIAYAKFASEHSNAQCILMLDPTLRDAAEDTDFASVLKLYEQAHSLRDANYRRIIWQHPNLVPSHRPYLIPLDPVKFADAHLLQVSVDLAVTDWSIDSLMNGQGHRVCGWLFSGHPVKVVAEHLGKLAVQRKEDGKHVLLRYFDPSIMSHLWDLTDATRKTQLLGPASHWLTLNHTKQLQNFSSSIKNSDRISASLGFRQTEWQTIENLSPLNQALTQWRSTTGNEISTSIVANTRHALDRGRHYGFHDNRDLKLFALYSLNIHPRFDMHPRVHMLVAKEKNSDYFATAIENLSDADWERVKSEMQNSTL